MKYYETNSNWFLCAISLVLGAGILIHPILLFLPVIIVVLPILREKTRRWRHVLSAGLLAIVALTPASLWIVRNKKVADYAGISCVTAVNLMKYKAAGVIADIHGTDLLSEAKSLRDECEAGLREKATRGERWRAWEKKAKAILFAHPVRYLKLHVQGMLREFFGPGRDDLKRLLYGRRILDEDGFVTDRSIEMGSAAGSQTILEVIRHIALSLQGMVFLCFFFGLLKLFRSRQFILGIGLLFPMLYVLNISGGPEAFCRFRVIYMPFVSIVSAIGLTFAVDFVSHFGLYPFRRDKIIPHG
jgi:hypothetical protein